MGVTTENGWPQCGLNQIVRPLVPGTNGVRPEVRAGVVSTILVAWCAWWHKNIYAIDTYKPRDYWGWSATNDVWNSNHLSGTAVDLNATRLPWQRYSMPQHLVDKIRNVGLPAFEGTIYWGGNWGRVDQMHSQINLAPGSAKLNEFASRLLGGHLGIYGPADVPPPVVGPPVSSDPSVLQFGSRGPRVATLQAFLNRNYPAYSNLAVDGDFGAMTRGVVMEFQNRSGLPMDGVVGPATLKKLGVKL